MTIYVHQNPDALTPGEPYCPVGNPEITTIAQGQAMIATLEAAMVAAQARFDRYANAPKNPGLRYRANAYLAGFALRNLAARVQERILALGGSVE
ncbi:MAG: hypothetical protein HY791_39590 [Deltaproteobacteria bacterium]|nr:hypothetical protein [Deltaproteobacteria bacterium]